MKGRGLLVALLLLLLPAAAHAESEIVADISSHVVAVTTGFTGAELIVFGSIREVGDIAIVIEGPKGKATTRVKSRVLGIWINTDSFVFDDVPGFYSISTSQPVLDIASSQAVNEKGIKLDRLHFPSRRTEDIRTNLFRKALITRREVRGFYRESPQGVDVLEDRLFRSSFFLPANAPIGKYKARIYLFREGQTVASQTVPFSVEETGLSATVFE
ncbi:MAG: TIGR02186 family protein, partial [Bdellovibrionales bacterium]